MVCQLPGQITTAALLGVGGWEFTNLEQCRRVLDVNSYSLVWSNDPLQAVVFLVYFTG